MVAISVPPSIRSAEAELGAAVGATVDPGEVH